MTDLSPEAKRLFDRARADFEPSQEQVASLSAAVAARIGAGGGSAPNGQHNGAAGPAGSSGWMGSTIVSKAIGATLLVGVVAAGFVYRARSEPPARTQTAAVTPSTAPPIAAKPPQEPENAEASGVPSIPWADLPRAPVEPRTRLTRATGSPLHAATDVGSRDAPVTKSASNPSAAESAPPVSSARASLVDEIRIVRSAHAALDRGDAAAALALTDEHRSRYPQGTLNEENLALRVRALCALGRSDAARSTAVALLRTAPDSPYRAGLRASCVGPDVDP